MSDKKRRSKSTPEREDRNKIAKRTGENKRTRRACDRCRFKKSKCNGLQPCLNCQTNERTCVYSARRRRDARNWYYGMQEIVDEAFQRMYKACKDANVFPGTLPQDCEGRVTTEDILQGLGLVTEPGPFSQPEDWPASAVSQNGISTTAAQTDVDAEQSYMQRHHYTEPSERDNSPIAKQTFGSTTAAATYGSRKFIPTSILPSQVLSRVDMDMCQQFDDALLMQDSTYASFVADPFIPTLATYDGRYSQQQQAHHGSGSSLGLSNTSYNSSVASNVIQQSSFFDTQPQTQQTIRFPQPSDIDLNTWTKSTASGADGKTEVDIDPTPTATLLESA